MWSSGIMLALQRLFLGYCMFVIVMVWILKRAKRLRDTPRTQDGVGGDREPLTRTNRS